MLLSIIIPIYNREQTLKRCLLSIQNLCLRDIEVLMIDDGSSDNSSLICKEFERADKRFHYYYKKNGGVSSARNYGISQAQGKWITFIDSDDWVLPNHFSYIKDYENLGVLYITGGVGLSKISDSPNVTGATSLPELERVNLSGFFKSKINYNPIYLVVNKCFYSEIIKRNHIRFKEDVSLGEDQIFVNHYLLYAVDICYVNEQTYIQWCDTLGSLTKSRRKIKDHFHCIWEVFKSFISLAITSKNLTIFMYALRYFLIRVWQRVVKLFIKRLIGRE